MILRFLADAVSYLSKKIWWLGKLSRRFKLRLRLANASTPAILVLLNPFPRLVKTSSGASLVNSLLQKHWPEGPAKVAIAKRLKIQTLAFKSCLLALQRLYFSRHTILL